MYSGFPSIEQVMLLVCRQSRLSWWEYHNRGPWWSIRTLQLWHSGSWFGIIYSPPHRSQCSFSIQQFLHALELMLILSTEQGYVMCVHGSFYVWTLCTISMILSSRWRDGATRRVQLCLALVMIFGKATGVQFYLFERNFKSYLWSVWKIILDFSGTGSQSTWKAWGKSWRPYLKHQEARKWT